MGILEVMKEYVSHTGISQHLGKEKNRSQSRLKSYLLLENSLKDRVDPLQMHLDLHIQRQALFSLALHFQRLRHSEC